MRHQLGIVVLGLFLSSAAFAQDYGLTIGVHQTNATVDVTGSSDVNVKSLTGGSTSGMLGFDLGLTMSFELMPNFRFRSGALYNSRPFEYKGNTTLVGAYSIKANYAWIDIPVNAQYNFTPTFGIYGGMIVAIKASDAYSVTPSGGTNPDLGVKSMYPLLNLGVNFTFQDMLGFDLYYESGMGSFSDVAKNYSTFGMHFHYWL